MSTKGDREHFQTYRPQTRAKHQILKKYVSAYFKIMSARSGSKNLVYLDGFAGRGTYDDNGVPVPGSPLQALQLIADDPALASKVTTVFIEQDSENFAALESELKTFHTSHSHVREPACLHGSFTAHLTDILNSLKADGAKLAPAFVFVDPCGLSGVSFQVIDSVLRAQERCEAFIFFNIDGVRRLLGWEEEDSLPGLIELLGTEDRARELSVQFKSTQDAAVRETMIISCYERLLREETPARYVTSFRVEKDDRRSTSHYLIHASQHPLGFRIMKDVMWSVGQTDEGIGGLEFEQASLTGMAMLFKTTAAVIEKQILAELAAGPQRVSHFYNTLSEQPDNNLCASAYRPVLLDLERRRAIVVLDKECKAPAPASTRPKKHGMATLAEGYWIKLP